MKKQKQRLVAAAAAMLLGASVLVVGPASIKKAATKFKYTPPTSTRNLMSVGQQDEKEIIQKKEATSFVECPCNPQNNMVPLEEAPVVALRRRRSA